MKRCLVSLMMAVLFLFGSMAVSAAVSVDGGYLFGTAEYDGHEVDANGFVLRADADVADPFGVVGDAAFVTDDEDYKINDWNIYATYTPPITITEGLDLKVLAGYGSANTDGFYYGDLTLRGFRVGAAASYKLDKIAVDGEVTFGLGTKGVWDEGDKVILTADESDEFDASSLAYRVSVAYDVMANVAVEAGYLNSSFEADEGPDVSYSGFFIGAKATF